MNQTLENQKRYKNSKKNKHKWDNLKGRMKIRIYQQKMKSKTKKSKNKNNRAERRKKKYKRNNLSK